MENIEKMEYELGYQMAKCDVFLSKYTKVENNDLSSPTKFQDLGYYDSTIFHSNLLSTLKDDEKDDNLKNIFLQVQNYDVEQQRIDEYFSKTNASLVKESLDSLLEEKDSSYTEYSIGFYIGKADVLMALFTGSENFKSEELDSLCKKGYIESLKLYGNSKNIGIDEFVTVMRDKEYEKEYLSRSYEESKNSVFKI